MLPSFESEKNELLKGVQGARRLVQHAGAIAEKAGAAFKELDGRLKDS
jgi:hypothetical protein